MEIGAAGVVDPELECPGRAWRRGARLVLLADSIRSQDTATQEQLTQRRQLPTSCAKRDRIQTLPAAGAVVLARVGRATVHASMVNTVDASAAERDVRYGDQVRALDTSMPMGDREVRCAGNGQRE
jgi:hypothetical protein